MSIPTTQLGTTDLTVTRYCQGTAFRHLPRRSDAPVAEQVLHHCLDRGVTFFDSAQAYGWGGAEELLGKVLQGRRSEVVVCTKVHPTLPPETEGQPGTPTPFTSSYLADQLDVSLRRLQTDYVDIYLLHQPDPRTPAEEICASMDRLIQSGKARFWGVSNFSASTVTEYLEIANASGSAPPSVLEDYYNISGAYSFTDDGQSRMRLYEREMFPVIRDHGLGTMFFSPLDAAQLATSWKTDPGSPLETLHAEIDAVARDIGAARAEVCIAWVLDHPETSAVLAGPEHPDHVDEMLRGVALDLPADVRRRLDEASLAFSNVVEDSF